MAFFESDQWQPWLPQYAVGSLTFPQAVQMGFLLLDAQIRQDPDLMTAGGVVLGGTTACAVWVADKYLFSGNVGDSRLVLSYNGRAFPVTSDHKPANQLEAARIERAGHFVRNARVNGQLAIVRAFGDYRFKVRPRPPTGCGTPGPTRRSSTLSSSR